MSDFDETMCEGNIFYRTRIILTRMLLYSYFWTKTGDMNYFIILFFPAVSVDGDWTVVTHFFLCVKKKLLLKLSCDTLNNEKMQGWSENLQYAIRQMNRHVECSNAVQPRATMNERHNQWSRVQIKHNVRNIGRNRPACIHRNVYNRKDRTECIHRDMYIM